MPYAYDAEYHRQLASSLNLPPDEAERSIAEQAARWAVCQQFPQDYDPWGETERGSGDCSCGCAYYLAHDGDWGTCLNPASHRAGLLTFEHQGCLHFEYDDDIEEDTDHAD